MILCKYFTTTERRTIPTNHLQGLRNNNFIHDKFNVAVMLCRYLCKASFIIVDSCYFICKEGNSKCSPIADLILFPIHIFRYYYYYFIVLAVHLEVVSINRLFSLALCLVSIANTQWEMCRSFSDKAQMSSSHVRLTFGWKLYCGMEQLLYCSHDAIIF